MKKLFTLILAISLLLVACAAPAPTAAPAASAHDIAVELATIQAAAVTPVVPTPVVIPPTNAPAPATSTTTQWPVYPLSYAYDVVQKDGGNWEMPKETYLATDLSNGRYDAVNPNPSSPDLGYCQPGQRGCPAWLGIYQYMVKDPSLKAQMDIPTRFFVAYNGVAAGDFRLKWAFNPGRTPDELMQDYSAAASGGDLGLFIATKDGLMPNGILSFNGIDTQFGYSCWDCLAHTSGELGPQPIKLDDESVDHFGTPTIPLSGSLLPGIVVPIPSPKDNPAFMLDLQVHVPAGSIVVVWFGRYDVPPTP